MSPAPAGPGSGWEQAGAGRGRHSPAGRAAHFPLLLSHCRQQRQSVGAPTATPARGLPPRGGGWAEGPRNVHRPHSLLPPWAGFSPPSLRRNFKRDSARCFRGRTGPKSPVCYTRAGLFTAMSPAKPCPGAMADRPGAAAHAKSASQIGLWESRSPPLNYVLTHSACSPKCAKASLILGGEVFKHLFKKQQTKKPKHIGKQGG